MVLFLVPLAPAILVLAADLARSTVEGTAVATRLGLSLFSLAVAAGTYFLIGTRCATRDGSPTIRLPR